MKKKSKDKALTPEQCAKVLSVAEGEMKALVLVAMTTGQRIRDILTLKRTDIDRVRKIIRFNIAKTGAILETPLDPRVGIWLDQLLALTMPVDATTPLFPRLAVRGAANVASSLRRLGRKVGVDVYPASLRHTYCRVLIARGTPIWIIQKMMGYRRRK